MLFFQARSRRNQKRRLKHDRKTARNVVWQWREHLQQRQRGRDKWRSWLSSFRWRKFARGLRKVVQAVALLRFGRKLEERCSFQVCLRKVVFSVQLLRFGRKLEGKRCLFQGCLQTPEFLATVAKMYRRQRLRQKYTQKMLHFLFLARVARLSFEHRYVLLLVEGVALSCYALLMGSMQNLPGTLYDVVKSLQQSNNSLSKKRLWSYSKRFFAAVEDLLFSAKTRQGTLDLVSWQNFARLTDETSSAFYVNFQHSLQTTHHQRISSATKFFSELHDASKHMVGCLKQLRFYSVVEPLVVVFVHPDRQRVWIEKRHGPAFMFAEPGEIRISIIAWLIIVLQRAHTTTVWALLDHLFSDEFTPTTKTNTSWSQQDCQKPQK